MPIVIQCSCGKTFRAKDSDAGRKARCPGCQQIVAIPSPRQSQLVGAAASTDAGAPPSQKRVTASFLPKASSLHPDVSTGAKGSGLIMGMPPTRVLLIGTVLAVVLVMVIVFTMIANTENQWQAASKRAKIVIGDVLSHAMQIEEARNGMGNRRDQAVVTGSRFTEPGFRLRMPESVPFTGESNRGRFRGNYHPRTGDIEAILDCMPNVKVTGREVGNDIAVQFNGVPASMPASADPDSTDQ